MGMTLVPSVPAVCMDWLSSKGLEGGCGPREESSCELGSRLMVVFEDMAYTRTLLTGAGIGVFSAGSGRLRTVSARAGCSLISGRATGFASLAWRCLRRYQRNTATMTPRKSRAPIMPPMRAPLLTPEEEDEEEEGVRSTHFVWLHAEQLLARESQRARLEDRKTNLATWKHCWVEAQLHGAGSGQAMHCACLGSSGSMRIGKDGRVKERGGTKDQCWECPPFNSPASLTFIPHLRAPLSQMSTFSSPLARAPCSSVQTAVSPCFCTRHHLTHLLTAGKSTLLQILAGKKLISAPGTDVRVKGCDVFRDTPDGITYLGTEWSVTPNMSSLAS